MTNMIMTPCSKHSDNFDFIFRDMFVEEYMKPPNKVITESNLDFIFNLDDESMIVSRNFLIKRIKL